MNPYRYLVLEHDLIDPIPMHTSERLTYEQMRKLVGGTIEATYPLLWVSGKLREEAGDGPLIWMGEEARMTNPYTNYTATAMNRKSYGYNMVGDGVVTSSEDRDDGDFEGISNDELVNLVLIYPELQESQMPIMTFETVMAYRKSRREVNNT